MPRKDLNLHTDDRLDVPDQPTRRDFAEACQELDKQRRHIKQLENQLRTLRWQAHRQTFAVQEIAEMMNQNAYENQAGDSLPLDSLVEVGRRNTHGPILVATVRADAWEAQHDEDRVIIECLH